MRGARDSGRRGIRVVVVVCEDGDFGWFESGICGKVSGDVG